MSDPSAAVSIQLDTRGFDESLLKNVDGYHGKLADCLKDLRDKTCKGSDFTGWYDWPAQQGFDLVKAVEDWREQLVPFYDAVVVCGIGGSYLGMRAAHEALSHAYEGQLEQKAQQKPQVFYVGHHLSEESLIETMDALDAKQPLLVVISKSGTTTEPGIAFRIMRNYLEKRFGAEEAAQRTVAVTDPKSGALRSLAEANGLKTFEIPPDVGGRFSVLTAVGIVPLTLAGVDVTNLMAGAGRVFADVAATGADHPALRYAACRMAAHDAGKSVEVLAYADPKLSYMTEWWKQLFGESEGKQGMGLFPASLALTTDLHSLGQYLQDGKRSMMETFVVFGETSGKSSLIERRLKIPESSHDDGLGYLAGQYVEQVNAAAMSGTQVAHTEGQVPTVSLRLGQRDAAHIGAFFAFHQVACGISAALLDVNPYDQPGVEDYKKNLFALMGRPGFEGRAQELRSHPLLGES